MSPRKPHILVTGGAGYIGSVLCGELLRRGFRVTVLDTLLFGGDSLRGHTAHPNFIFHRADVRDKDAMASYFIGVDHVVHLAAIVGYPACASAGREASFNVNFEGTRNVFALAEERGVRRFVFASTYSVYGVSGDRRPVTEESPLRPQSLYAQTKIAAENFLIEQAKTSRCAPVVLRFATLFGPSPRTRFDLIINQFVLEAIRKGHLVIYQKDDNRSFVHIGDIVRAIELALEASLTIIRGQIFNAGSNDGNYSKEGLVALIRKYVPGLMVEYKNMSYPEDMRDIRVSFDRIERRLGFKAKVSVENGIREMTEAIRSGRLMDKGVAGREDISDSEKPKRGLKYKPEASSG
jgi:nucleoside-diphosphate-sugar epimerase